MVMSTFLAWLLVNPILPMLDCPRDARPPQVVPPPVLPEPAAFTAQASPLPCVEAKSAFKTRCVAEAGPMITRVYQVADLVVPIAGTPTPAPTPAPVAAAACPTPCVTGTSQQPQHTTENRLMAMIRAQVAPASWVENGGSAGMDYYPIGMSLIVRQTAACHEQIAELLQSLHREQDTQVVLEVRLIAVPGDFNSFQPDDFLRPASIGEARGPITGAVFTPDLGIPTIPATDAPLFLDDKGLHSFLDVAMADRRSNVLMMPKLTVINGQDAKIAATEQQYFVTEITETKQKDRVLQVPHNQAFTTGMTFQVQPVVSADRRYIKMKLSVQDTELAVTPPPMTPVTTFVTPIFEGGAEGQPIPFTQYIQHPTFDRHELERTLTVADGKTVVLSGWTRQRPAQPLVPEVLRDLPFLSCLFLNACPTGTETQRVLVLVTPRVLMHEQMESKPPMRTGEACPKPSPIVQAVYEEPPQAPADTPLQEILANYQAACARGDRAAATRWAVRALAIEPTCFGKTAR